MIGDDLIEGEYIKILERNMIVFDLIDMEYIKTLELDMI
jgi:hypothetical protein